MNKLKKIKTESGGYRYWFWCPGCKNLHQFAVPGWDFDGNMEEPTFSPSLLNSNPDGVICHLFLKKGKIQFCNDCPHELSGQTVDLPDLPESWRG